MAIAIDTNTNIYDLSYGGKMAIAGKKPTILILATYVELYILLFLWVPLWPGRVHTCFYSEGPGLSFALEAVYRRTQDGVPLYGIGQLYYIR